MVTMTEVDLISHIERDYILNLAKKAKERMAEDLMSIES